LVFEKVPKIYRVSWKKDFQESQFLESFKKEKPNSEKQTKLRMLIIGMTRSGKSSLINFFYTWSKGW
jgi:ribosome biogenesis GTPase A